MIAHVGWVLAGLLIYTDWSGAASLGRWVDLLLNGMKPACRGLACYRSYSPVCRSEAK